MKFQRRLWSGNYDRENFPKFPCPNCKEGLLQHDKNSTKIEEPLYSKKNRDSEDWEPDWDVERFKLSLICDSPTCGEIVVVSGETSLTEYYDEENGRWVYEALLRPRSFFPAPNIISVPEGAPEDVLKSIRLASTNFWVDPSASANRLRASVEYLLDFLEIAREKVNSTGKPSRLSLNERIAAYEHVNAEHARSLTALRMIGNLGSHGDDVHAEALLDAFEVYEDTLEDLCGQRKERLEHLRQKLISTKGDYSKGY
ncbi:DUF4145 domain-containing protein [uncultured Xanthomonas sp.]|uniref:DUF4145 domain-containing protein n=1 Tax=uncultured Xanthomonas sp. TaxID=152831 RepID=UPI0025E916E7|nr:DUF4145 domain-containing protein [uncultured Xanthomonas sp.]